MRHARSLFAAVALGSLSACTSSASATPKDAPPVAAAPLTALPSAFVQSNDAFAGDLYAQLAKKPGNLFVSPASISTALAMTYAGANGATASEMAKTMHFDLASKDLHDSFRSLLARLDSVGGKNPELRVANRLFGQKGMTWEAPFVDVTKKDYAADLGIVDYIGANEAARLTINGWVLGKTNGKIEDLLPVGSIDELTRLVLTNAIYFKGNWASQFKKSDTKDEPFVLAAAKTKNVPTMHQTLEARYGETSDAQVLSLPYASADPDHAMSMVIILPKKSDGLAALEKDFTGKKLETYASALGHAEVTVSLPKFKMTYGAELGETLLKMGMPLAFDESAADFSKMTKMAHLHISRVIHKAFVDVNEEGTEAAAATAVVMTDESAAVPPPPKTFKADHPFAFMIRDDESGSILFMGRVADPT